MANLILSTLALLGCAFLIYVLFHWLRDELNPKRPRSGSAMQQQRGPFLVRDAHGHNT
jgi:threonine/homoserine/homoserine lactone efflux protein